MIGRLMRARFAPVAFIVGGLVSIAATVQVNDYVIRARIWRPRMPRLSAEVSP